MLFVYIALIIQMVLAGLKLNKDVGHATVAFGMTVATTITLLAFYFVTWSTVRERTNWWVTAIYVLPFFLALGDVVATTFWGTTRVSASYRMAYSAMTAVLIGVLYFAVGLGREERA
jgi:hypothetical protein